MYGAMQKTGTLEGRYGTVSPSRRSTTLKVVDGQRFFEVVDRIEKIDRVAIRVIQGVDSVVWERACDVISRVKRDEDF